MNKTINELNRELENVNANVADIETRLQAAWNTVFKDSTKLRDNVALLEQSSEYSFDKYGEIVSWRRFYDLKDYKECASYLEAYLSDQGVGIDWENDCLTYNLGPCILINNDGDVLDQDSQKWIISKNDYRDDDGNLDEGKRNELIEAWMDKHGYYPGVFSADRHGNVFAVNTTITKGTE